jgi:hypothetical protein
MKKKAYSLVLCIAAFYPMSRLLLSGDFTKKARSLAETCISPHTTAVAVADPTRTLRHLRNCFGDLVGPHLEALQCVRAEGRCYGYVGCVAASGD